MVSRILENLNSLEYDGHPAKRKEEFPGVKVYLHDEIATAEELEKMILGVEIHILTQEELDDR